ncbi:hypothetical protein [Enterococcus hirae]|uniref:hypothetical protein n=1 Tax=Enterococcus hirae TaxID=1354 RepID=UPI00136F1C4C|nr:hypothetical protein [Enterococcus hirae]NAE18222.1 hypothetical protein [Enterococcus hirae]
MSATEDIRTAAQYARAGQLNRDAQDGVADLLDEIADDIASYERLGGFSPIDDAHYGFQAAAIAAAQLGHEPPTEAT